MSTLRTWTRAVAPDGHLTGRPLVAAVLIAAAAAAFWGALTRLPFVAIATFLTQVFFAWVTPPGRETLRARIHTAFMAGGTWAAIGMIVFGR